MYELKKEIYLEETTSPGSRDDINFPFVITFHFEIALQLVEIVLCVVE